MVTVVLLFGGFILGALDDGALIEEASDGAASDGARFEVSSDGVITDRMAGQLELPAGTRFVVNSDGYVNDMIVQKDNIVSLGKYPQYVLQAQANGERTFEMSDEAWQSMKPEDRDLVNQRFLKKYADSNAVFHLATDWSQATSSYAKELEYLSSRGYTPTPDGSISSKRIMSNDSKKLMVCAHRPETVSRKVTNAWNQKYLRMKFAQVWLISALFESQEWMIVC